MSAMAVEETVNNDAVATTPATGSAVKLPIRTTSDGGIPPPGQSLTGKQEHCETSSKFH